MSKKERKERQQKKKDELKQFEYLLSAEERKLSTAKKNQLIINLISKSAKERNETIQDNNSSEVKKGKYNTEYVYRTKKMKIDNRDITFHTDFEHSGNI